MAALLLLLLLLSAAAAATRGDGDGGGEAAWRSAAGELGPEIAAAVARMRRLEVIEPFRIAPRASVGNGTTRGDALRLSPSELARLEGGASHPRIPRHADFLRVDVSAFGREMELWLRPAPARLAVRGGGEEEAGEGVAGAAACVFEGAVAGDAEAFGVVDVCDGGLRGLLVAGGEAHFIHPLGDARWGRAAAASPRGFHRAASRAHAHRVAARAAAEPHSHLLRLRPHLIYSLDADADAPLGTCGVHAGQPDGTGPAPQPQQLHRAGLARTGSGSLTGKFTLASQWGGPREVELAIAAENAVSRRMPSFNLTFAQHVTFVATVVDRLFAQIGVRVHLAYGVSLSASPPFGIESTPSRTLSNFQGWGRSQNVPGALPHDAMHLLLSSQVSGVIGLAFSPRETCEPEATQSTYGIVRDWSVQPPGPTQSENWAMTSLILTHELGHNLGATLHDDEAVPPCSSTSNIMMAGIRLNSRIWSGCALSQMNRTLPNATCLASRRTQARLICPRGSFDTGAENAVPVENRTLARCAPCHPSCDECRGSNAAACTRCPEETSLSGGVCVATCPNGTFSFFSDGSVQIVFSRSGRVCRNCSELVNLNCPAGQVQTCDPVRGGNPRFCFTPDTTCDPLAPPDSDGDGVADCADRCPGDAAKVEPGACGCFTPDADRDGDGVPDCVDACPDDRNKFTAGTPCGCGVPDTDSDGDGTADCRDGCPNDRNKTAPGACGCGVRDSDGDGDGVPDCVDGCPNDRNKTAPGVCGCGVPDTDSDGDGVLNCLDGCPNDRNKTAPGLCGCGAPEAAGCAGVTATATGGGTGGQTGGGTVGGTATATATGGGGGGGGGTVSASGPPTAPPSATGGTGATGGIATGTGGENFTDPFPPALPPPESAASSSLLGGTGAIVGLAVGAAALLVLVPAVWAWLARRRRRELVGRMAREKESRAAQLHRAALSQSRLSMVPSHAPATLRRLSVAAQRVGATVVSAQLPVAGAGAGAAGPLAAAPGLHKRQSVVVDFAAGPRRASVSYAAAGAAGGDPDVLVARPQANAVLSDRRVHATLPVVTAAQQGSFLDLAGLAEPSASAASAGGGAGAGAGAVAVYDEGEVSPPELEEAGGDGAPALPAGWSRHLDEASGCYYFYHAPSGTTQWEHPATAAHAAQL